MTMVTRPVPNYVVDFHNIQGRTVMCKSCFEELKNCEEEGWDLWDSTYEACERCSIKGKEERTERGAVRCVEQ